MKKIINMMAALTMAAASIAHAESADTTALQNAFDQASATPAPARSLYMPATEKLARDIFRGNNVLVLGELHHSTNYKFLADNPAFLREAAIQGGKHLYIELTSELLPLTRAYFNNQIDEETFSKETQTFYRENVYTGSSGPSDDHARQYIALCKTAKSESIEVIPSDFRILRAKIGTSESLGVPDMMGPDDEIRRHTLRTLKTYRDITGKALPLTAEDQRQFSHIHLDTRPTKDQNPQYWRDLENRIMEWSPYDTLYKEAVFQNELQARYVAHLSKPGEKIIFIGGSRHFAEPNSIGDHAQKGGYGPILGIELLAGNGVLWRAGLESPETIQLYKTGHQFSYRIHTEEGRLFDLRTIISITNKKGPDF